MDRRLKIIFGVVIGVIVLIFFIRFLTGSEDTWICSSGEWIKHGNPSGLMPDMPCE